VTDREVHEALLEQVRAGRMAVFAVVVRASGSTPRAVGAKMLVRSDGTTVGTVGGGAFEAMVTQDALDLLASSAPAPAVKRYTFTEHGEDALGMACGGTAEVLLDPSGAGERLVIFGAGHVGLALARLAATVGFRPQIVDDRPAACEAAREAGIGEVFCCDSRYEDGVPPVEAATWVAVVTRCHQTDRLALRRALGTDARYVGLIGSRRKKAVIFQQLRDEDGVSDGQMARVRCPIGLPLGGDTPEEIAVSIVAQLLQERHATREG